MSNCQRIPARFAVLFCLLFSFLPVYSNAQQQEDTVALWVAAGSFSINPPSSSDSHKKSEYIEAVHKAGAPTGTGYGTYMDTSLDFLGIEGIGLGLGRSQGSYDLNEIIDPENTPGIAADDVTLTGATRFASNFVVFLKTICFLTLGIGTEDGYFVFDTKSASGQSGTETFEFSYQYLHISVAYGGKDGPYVALLANFMNSAISGDKMGDFSGNTTALIAGWKF
jgi:hypothetical protein